MTDKETLQKAIEIAMDNGYRLQYYKSIKFSDDITESPTEEYNHVSHSIIFSHDFAKAFLEVLTQKTQVSIAIGLYHEKEGLK